MKPDADDRQTSLLSPSDSLLRLPNSLPHSNDTTSKTTAKTKTTRTRAAGDRIRVLDFIRRQGKNGATADEIQAALDMTHQSGSARVSELLNKYGEIKDSGRQRKTRSGSNATVYVVDELAEGGA